ncbi:ribonuclease III [Oceaniovalibus guishaninsula JLT2003]|uniref:Ribonuclease III n=1 Tax=Oceaniovalibus guishaninsula JLT2003 TaxID=1231392 RepID=K2I694_9RHOB|nr:DUF2793 domain-containing protein [Oceaniovalibus guishaninsula]EKE44505.1 ribonuclease III [Oceaniovalibus guishaninsula JLT2003]
MTDTSPRLDLPLIQPSQAQKHVTHNEAVLALDTVVQLSIAGFDLAAPPADPLPGATYALGAAPSAEWAGQGGRLATWGPNGWRFIAPADGWIGWDTEGAQLRVRKNGVWEVLAMGDAGNGGTGGGAGGGGAGGALDLQNVPGLGIGTAWDATNRLAVHGTNALLTSDGGFDIAVNKAAAGDDASLTFKTAYAPRALMGLLGRDDFGIKVADDSGTYRESLRIDRASGAARFPSGARVSQVLHIPGKWQCAANGQWAGLSDNSGHGAETYNQNYGPKTGEPTSRFVDLGPFVRRGSRIVALRGVMRANQPDLSAFDVRVYHQTGANGDFWGNDYARTEILSRDGVPIPGTAMYVVDLAIGYDVPKDGLLIMALRPSTPIASTRFIYSSLAFYCLTAPD